MKPPIQPCIVESPYAGDVQRNKAYLQRCLAYCVREGYTPYASHQMLTECLDDMTPEQRRLGLDAGLHYTRWALKHGASWFVFADLGVSPGMRETILALQADGFRPTVVLLSLDPVDPFDPRSLAPSTKAIREELAAWINNPPRIVLDTAHSGTLGPDGGSDHDDEEPTERKMTWPAAPTDEQIEAERARARLNSPSSLFDAIMNEPDPVPVSRFDGRSHQAKNADHVAAKYGPPVLQALPGLTLPYSGTAAHIREFLGLDISPSILGQVLSFFLEDGKIDGSRNIRIGKPIIYEIRGVGGAAAAKPATVPVPPPVAVKAEPAPLPAPIAPAAVPIGGELTPGRVIDVLVELGKIEALNAEAARILLGRPAVDMQEIQRVRSLLRTPTDQWVFSFRVEPRLGGEIWKLA